MEPRKKTSRLAITAALVYIGFACVTQSSSTVMQHRWWAGLGPVLPHDTFPTDCTTLQECIQDAASGDVVRIATATPIDESPILNRSVTLEAAPGAGLIRGSSRQLGLPGSFPTARRLRHSGRALPQIGKRIARGQTDTAKSALSALQSIR